MIFAEHIMIVEDEAITQRYLKEIVSEMAVKRIDCFDNAEDALQAMHDSQYQLILMDINIKGSVDGVQLSKIILERYVIPIVFISAYADDETIEEILSLSPYGFIIKPFSSSEVLVSLKVAYQRFLTDEANKCELPKENKVYIGNQYAYAMDTHTLLCKGEILNLHTKQKALIEILMKNINSTVSIEILTNHLWKEQENVSDSSLRTLVYSLRKTLQNFPLHTYSKSGYALSSQENI